LRRRHPASKQNGRRSQVFAAKPRQGRKTHSCQGKAESKPAAAVPAAALRANASASSYFVL